ncbi:MAG TPA: MBL fold metallo-hydrolase [Kofleriaceae bacterium]|nr:MBL fold metallo-hydrolase [Kofleriaceae bacterium]
MQIEIEALFDPETFTLTYVVFDPATRDAVVIDPVLDYDVLASRTSTRSVERVAAFVRQRELRMHYVLETHAHADHLSGSQWLRKHFAAKIAIGGGIRDVQQTFRDVFDMPALAVDGSQFDRLLADGEVLTAGSLRIETIATPGHTPACVTYKIGDALFTGDALFMPDYGTGRCDFPRGSAEKLYDSVQRLYAFPDDTRVFPGHDYQPKGRPLAWESTIGQEKRENIQLKADTARDAFVGMRTTRDKTLAPPRLLYPSVQVNIDAGRLPEPHGNGRRYLAIPLAEASGDEPFVDVDPETVARLEHDVMLVDVREPHEFVGELGHVPEAQLVPLAKLVEASATWDRDREIVLVCRSGGRSAHAATELAKRGFRRLFNLRGGMLAWNEARLPVER